MKKLLFLTFILFFVSVHGQRLTKKIFDIQYEKESIDNGNSDIIIGHKPLMGYWDDALSIPVFTKHFETNKNDGAIVSLDVETELVPKSEAQYINTEYVQSSFNFTYRVVSQRGKKYGVVEGNCVRINNAGQLERVIKLEADLDLYNIPTKSERGFTNQSVLSNSNASFFKFGVTENGIHKLDVQSLQSNGIDLIGESSNSVNVYGNGQGMLSVLNSESRIDDLYKNAIYVEDGGDGVLNQGDFILFYANGPHDIRNTGTRFTHVRNNFTDTSYYYLEVDPNGSPKRITNAQVATNPSTNSITKFHDFSFIEDDKVNLNKSGQEWYGDLYDAQLSTSHSFPFDNLTSDSAVVEMNVIIQSPNNAPYFTLSSGGISHQWKSNSASGSGYLSPKGVKVLNVEKYGQGSNSVNLNLSFSKAGNASAVGYLDYISVTATRALTYSGNQMEFANLDSYGAGVVNEYLLDNASSVAQIWEVTDPREPKLVPFSLVSNQAEFTMNADSVRTFVAHNSGQFLTPQYFGKVNAQNLHGLSYADAIMIAPSVFYNAAQTLADFHINRGLSVHLVKPNEIYNEFSSGMRDPMAIRHFLKMFYDRAAGNASLMPKYCIIVGDCSYDYRNILNSNSDYVITYESLESLTTTSTFAADDMFGLLDDNEAISNADVMDIAIGRIPVENVQDLQGYIQKIKRYVDSDQKQKSFRDWRNVVCMVSDDEDGNAYFNDVELMESILSSTHNDLNIQKLHSDAFAESVTPGGERNEGVSSAIANRVDRGALLVNYIGHGGELGWAHETILTVPTIQGWQNDYAMPVFMTATCEFSRYDDHDRVSAGEYVILNPNGGGIGLFTTTRLVFSSSNEKLARYFYDTVADFIDGKPQTLGEIYIGAKNKFALSNGGNDFRKFTLLADPSIPFMVPHYDVVLDSIDGINIASYQDTIKALSQVIISGHVEDLNGITMTDFGGYVYPTIYDKKLNLSTLANSPGSSIADFESWQNIIYKGKASVTNGYFEFSFVVPKDISYDIGNGRLSFYAADEVSKDANGFDESVKIGGINNNAPNDTEGPTLELFMNDEQFVNGGLTDENPLFLANIFDENGINTVGNGIGHNIELRIDDNAEPIILNDFYESDLDTYKSGKVSFQLSDLAPGKHTAYLKVWDVYNNSASGSLEFLVVEDEEIQIEHLLNYPNPFTTNTEFSFEHNQVSDYLDVQVQVFTLSGKVVKNIQQRIISDGFRISGINWDGRDDFGDKLAIGTYIYKLSVTTESGKNIEKFERLVLLN